MLKDGLYEQIINLALEQELDSFLSSEKKIEAVDPAEAPVLLAAYLREIRNADCRNGCGPANHLYAGSFGTVAPLYGRR